MVNITLKEAVSPTQRKVKKRLKWFMALNFLAILDTIYLTYMHFKPSASEWCKLSDYLDCDIVNKSIYAELFDIPVAILGLLTYLLLFGLAWIIFKNIRLTQYAKFLRPINLLWFMFVVVAGGVLFSGYLTYVELFVLHAVCVFCMAQQVIIIIDLFILLGILSLIDKGKKENPDQCEFC